MRFPSVLLTVPDKFRNLFRTKGIGTPPFIRTHSHAGYFMGASAIGIRLVWPVYCAFANFDEKHHSFDPLAMMLRPKTIRQKPMMPKGIM
jgi:hypothetical protein